MFGPEEQANPPQISVIRRLTSGRITLTAGVLDAAMSSLATFLAGLVAVNILGDAERGVYAVFFTAFNFGQVVANNLVYIPSEVTAVSWPLQSRLRVLTESIPLGAAASVAGALSIAAATVVGSQIADAAVVMPLTITAAATTLMWPTQDHLRRMLHIAERSWAAAAVSITQMVATAASIGVLIALDVNRLWIPFGALAVANTMSLAVGLALARPRRAGDLIEHLRLRTLIRSGAWLLVGVGVPTVTTFGAAAIISFKAGPEMLGFAEAARIAAQPLLVLGTGLGFVLGPKVMRSAISGEVAAAKRTHLRYGLLMLVAALAYAAIAGWQWPGNPMAVLIPGAFEIPWLVTATIGAHVLMASLVLVLQELMAAKRARTIAIMGIVSAPLQIAAAATATTTQAFARPLSIAVGNAVRLVGYVPVLRRSYGKAGDLRTFDKALK